MADHITLNRDEIKPSSQVKNQESKETPPKEGFKELVQNNELPFKKIEPRKKNIFEVSSEKNQKKDKETSQNSSAPLFVETINQCVQTFSESPVGSVTSTLPANVQELFDRMVESIQVETTKGISTTTVQITTKNPLSTFNGTELVLQHYDTHPHSFHLELISSPQAAAELGRHMGDLHTLLKEKFPTHKIDLKKPRLRSLKSIKKTI